MEQNELQRALMAILFAAGEPVAASRLSESLAVDEAQIHEELKYLMDQLSFHRSGIRIVRLEDAYQMCSAAEQAELVTKTLETRKPPKLSSSQLETLSVIAYYQPATKAYVEQIRGVDSGYSISALLTKKLIREAGRLNVPGRPFQYETTPDFLRVFGLQSLADLPPIEKVELSTNKAQLELPMESPAGEDGCVFVDADYSQIELRVLAHIAQDQHMQEAFTSGMDIHTATAAQVFHVAPEDVTPLMRRHAKAVNFGIVYGISEFSLAEDIGVTRKEAKAYIDRYLENYAGVRAYMKDIVAKAKQDGFVTTLFGRRRNLPELKSSNFNIRSFGERVALNTPIQGTAADIIKLAMLHVDRALCERKLQARLVLQVHDELIVECPVEERVQVTQLLTEQMQQVAKLSVPLLAEAKSGASWYEAK